MTFNKKRQCCCGVDTGPKYLEVFPKIDSTSSEKQLSGTYSYWIFLGDVANQPGTSQPAYNTVIFQVSSSTQNTNATSNIEYLDFTNTVFVSTGKFDCAANGETSWKKLVNSSGDRDQGVALARRGFTWNSSSRFLTESEVFALEENRIRVYYPGPSSDFGPRAFDTGYFFVSGQYDETPAISDNLTRSDGQTFGYVVYPKISANLPDRIFDEDGTVWFDFSAHFPSTLTLTFSGSGSLRVREGPLQNSPFQTKSYAVNFTATYEKVVVDNTTLRTSVVKYEKTNQSGEQIPFSDQYLVGPRVDFTVSFDGPNGPYDTVYNVGLKTSAPEFIFAHQNRYNAQIDIFGTSAFNFVPGIEYIFQRQGAKLNKNFSQNVDACYLFCSTCDGNSTGFTYDKTPFNFAGTDLDNKNSNAWYARHPSGLYIVATGANPPYEIEQDNTTGGEIPTNGLSQPQLLGWAPLLTWSDNASSGSITMNLEDGKYSGAPDAFYPDLPDLRCPSLGPQGAIDFFIGETGVPQVAEGAGPVEINANFVFPPSLFTTSIS